MTLHRKLFSRRGQTQQEALQTEIEQKQATLQYRYVSLTAAAMTYQNVYRAWGKEHDDMMKLLKTSLEVQCTSYFEDIRPKTVKVLMIILIIIIRRCWYY